MGDTHGAGTPRKKECFAAKNFLFVYTFLGNSGQNGGRKARISFSPCMNDLSRRRAHVTAFDTNRFKLLLSHYCYCYEPFASLLFLCLSDTPHSQWCPRSSLPGFCFLSPSMFAWPPSYFLFWDAHCTFALLISVNTFAKYTER